jgi:hypothetical protein
VVEHVRSLLIEFNNPVFDLVPAPLGNFINCCYDELGRPPVKRASIWHIYLQLLDLMRQCQGVGEVLQETNIGTAGDDLPLIQGLQDLLEELGYLGGVANGMGLRKYTFMAWELHHMLILIRRGTSATAQRVFE